MLSDAVQFRAATPTSTGVQPNEVSGEVPCCAWGVDDSPLNGQRTPSLREKKRTHGLSSAKAERETNEAASEPLLSRVGEPVADPFHGDVV